MGAGQFAVQMGHFLVGHRGEEDGVLRLEFSGEEFCLDFLNEQSRLELVNQLMSEFFGRNLRLECIRSGESADERIILPGKRREEIQQELLNHPLVHKAVEIFNARLEEVKVK